MFHWICPECGQEIAPGVKECPVCEPQASASSLPSPGHPTTATRAPEVASAAPAVTLAESVVAVAEPIVAPPVAAQSVASESDTAKTDVAAVAKPVAPQPDDEVKTVLQPEVILRPEVVLPPKAFEGQKPPVVLDAIPSEARPVVMPDVPVRTSPIELPHSLPDRPPQPETFSDRLADLAEILHGERIPYTAPRIFQESAAPGPHVETDPEKTPKIVDVTFHADLAPDGTPARPLLAAPPSRLLLAEPQPPSVAGDIPIAAFQPRPDEYTARFPEPLGAEPSVASPVQLPQPPNRGPAPALAPFENYSPAADRLMRPAEFVTPTAPAKALPKITLPGPALPRELMSLQAAGLVPLRTRGRRGDATPSRYGLLVKTLVLGILLTAGVATYSMMPGTTASAPPRPTPEPVPDPPVSAHSTRSTNSLARFVEVTGIRFMEVNKRPQIHYLVVNHSNAPLSSVTVYVTLRAMNAKPGQPPIARLNFRSPALAAFEAKEMFSSIERASAPIDLPDWQDLHADVEVQ